MNMMKQIRKEFDPAFVAQDKLEDAVDRSVSLLEAFAVLIKCSEDSETPLLSDSAAEGLKLIALQEGVNLRRCFDHCTELPKQDKVIAA
jgi:hypothetical protein